MARYCFGIAGHRLDDPATHELIARGYAGMNPGVLDPAARLDDQARDGIVGEVMYPSINMLTFSLPDRDVVQAVFRRHNDWVREYCSEAPERLIGVACLPLPDVDEAVAVLDRIFAGVPDEEAHKMTWDNVVSLYGIRLPETVDA